MRKVYDIAKESVAAYAQNDISKLDLLAVLIGTKATEETVYKLSLMDLEDLCDLSIEELKAFPGVGDAAAKRLYSAFSLAKKLQRTSKPYRDQIRCPEDLVMYFSDLAFHDQEHFEAVYLNTKNEVIFRKNIFKGSLNTSIVHPREVFKEAIRQSAASIAVAHNHPSKDPAPSTEDIQVTKRLCEVGQLIGIDVIDHIIIGDRHNWVSLKERGYI